MMSIKTETKGRLFIISAPSGAGKTTLCRHVLERLPELEFSVSYTTRKPRPNEQDGIHYHFIDVPAFEKGITAGRWLEYAKVHDNYYGTSAERVCRALNANRSLLLDIDVQGARQIMTRYSDAVSIFIMPPSFETLRQRLTGRGPENQEVIDKRMANAVKEIEQRHHYRHIIVNDTIDAAVTELTQLIESYLTNKS